jgi:asparagine N-glycosylation enzyme membrane subunit Stt3
MANNKLLLNDISSKQVLGLIIIAYIFSFVVRLIWVWQFQDNPSFMWNNELMINTNDGYFFATGAQEVLTGQHASNPRSADWLVYGVTFFTVLLTKILPFSLDTIILYMPAVISSMVVIPIILISTLYKQPLWGFFAALLGSITWSYYNRTMVGYYDTDMFSAMAPMFILYFLMKSAIDFKLRTALYAAMVIAIYPFLYDAGKAIIYAIGTIYALYLILHHKNDKITYMSLILIFFALVPLPIPDPYGYMVKVLLLIIMYKILTKGTFELEVLMLSTGILFILFMYFGHAFSLVFSKVMSYLSTGTVDGDLHFYSVKQTVREAGDIPFSTYANRTSGSVVGVLIALAGYVALVMRHRAFIIALPLIGIGIFAIWGGLRFTVYAVPVMAMSAIYFFYYLFNRLKENELKGIALILATFWFAIESILGTIQSYIVPNQRDFIDSLVLLIAQIGLAIKQIFLALFDTKLAFFNSNIEVYEIIILLASFFVAIGLFFVFKNWKKQFSLIFFVSFLTFVILIPNITHIISYKVPTVLNETEVKDLVKLNEISDSKDYTLTWWDYGYPIWYYSDTSTLIDGGKHNNDNYIISKILQATSQDFAANMSRLAVETYVSSDYKIVANELFKEKKPSTLLDELEHSDYSLPEKTRDIYLYLPYRMLRIFPTVSVFGNINLNTGKEKRKVYFSPVSVVEQVQGKVLFSNRTIYDSVKGTVEVILKEDNKYVKKTKKVYRFDVANYGKNGKSQVQSKLHSISGEFCVVFLQSYGQMIVMDRKTYDSAYVQMFMLEKYDKNLFELVISSPYSKIFKLKK